MTPSNKLLSTKAMWFIALSVAVVMLFLSCLGGLGVLALRFALPSPKPVALHCPEQVVMGPHGLEPFEVVVERNNFTKPLRVKLLFPVGEVETEDMWAELVRNELVDAYKEMVDHLLTAQVSSAQTTVIMRSDDPNHFRSVTRRETKRGIVDERAYRPGVFRVDVVVLDATVYPPAELDRVSLSLKIE
jgi:hypothetical protein